ncbi:MAG: MFS transporter [Deltaproteobacteria bacterium]|nr:MFS transporter [Deltaproteobacteria bacterium]
MNKTKQPKPYYGYVIVAASFIIFLLMWGAISSFGIFFKPMSQELGWTRTMISGAPSLSFLVMGVFGIIAGRLNDRYGPRVIVSISSLLMGWGYLQMARVSDIREFYLFYGIIIGIGASGPNIVLSSTIVRWFVKERGIMTGIFQVGSGVGTWILPLIANALILNLGWRTSFLILAAMVFGGILVASLFLKRDPGRMGFLNHGHSMEITPTNSDTLGLSFQEAITKISFWLVCMIFFIFLFCVLSIMIHIYPHAVDMGISESNAAKILSAIGATSIIGRFLIGALSDQIGYKNAVMLIFTLLGISCLWVLKADTIGMLFLFAGLFGLAQGGLFAVLSPWVADLFGVSAHGTIFGAVNLVGSVGSTIGPLLAGYLFDITGSYQLDFIILAVSCALAIILSIRIRPLN